MCCPLMMTVIILIRMATLATQANSPLLSNITFTSIFSLLDQIAHRVFLSFSSSFEITLNQTNAKFSFCPLSYVTIHILTSTVKDYNGFFFFDFCALIMNLLQYFCCKQASVFLRLRGEEPCVCV